MAIEKTKRMTIRFSPESLAWIKSKAKAAGISPSRWVREVALSKRSQDGQKQGKEFRLKQMLRKLSGIANNMNQVAKKANETGRINPGRYEETREDVAQFRIELLEELQ